MDTDMDTDEGYVPVSSTDELTIDGDEAADRVRKVGEFKPTNTPLSALEVEERMKHGWPPHTTDAIHDMVPVPERDGPADQSR